MQGKIIKGIAGFYYVHVPGLGVYECKARGIFRKDNVKPLVGDDVTIRSLSEEEKTGNIEELLTRRSSLIRPAVANIDQALVVFAITKPQPNFNLLDRFLILLKQQRLSCVICFTKEDLDEAGKGEEYVKMYREAGYPAFAVSVNEAKGLERVREVLAQKTTTLAGPSGVGKSTLINALQDRVVMETGNISRKIDRGKHTTRHSELIYVGADTYILDTPGFSSLGLFDLEKEELEAYYPEFEGYRDTCRFIGCSHITEPDCGVREALLKGKIHPVRYENYKLLYEELKKQKRY